MAPKMALMSFLYICETIEHVYTHDEHSKILLRALEEDPARKEEKRVESEKEDEREKKCILRVLRWFKRRGNEPYVHRNINMRGWTLVSRYLPILIRRGLISEASSTNGAEYKLTKDGLEESSRLLP